jgi:hypothetical protein
MRDVTTLMDRYRECARHLWNVYFLEQARKASDAAWDVRDDFARVCQLLFSALVLVPLGKDEDEKAAEYDQAKKPLSFLHVVPLPETAIPIDINREKVRSGYWDHPVNRVYAQDVDLRFIDFFDFDLLGFRDFEYYQVRIVEARDKDLVGREALIECRYSKVLAEE